MPNTTLHLTRLICLLLLACSVTLTFAQQTSDKPACFFSSNKRDGILPDFLQEDKSFHRIKLADKGNGEYQVMDDINKDYMSMLLTQTSIHLITKLKSTGRLRLIRITSTTGVIAYTYITDKDECQGGLDDSGLQPPNDKIASVYVLTLKGKPKSKAGSN